MIATGGLLRINAWRQDSLRSKAHKAYTQRKKNKKKRRSEVVVVKGKLKLISLSGFVAAVGLLVLLVGMVMAALGYWPRDRLFLPAQPKEGASMASSSSALIPADTHRGGGVDGRNRTETVNGTTRQPPLGFLEDFLDRYLYSDRMKVFGPLIMGIGIFLFICANAVLHENRDKKTKVINLRDIYSTVIDLHSHRRTNASSAARPSANPLNGLVNYVQSKSLETKPRAYPASLMARGEGGGGGGEGGGGLQSRQPLAGSSEGGRGGGGDDGGGRETVFSIYQEPGDTPPTPFSSQSLSHRPSFTPPELSTWWTSLKKETLSSFTLPLRRQRPPAPRRRHSARGGLDWGGGEEEVEEGGGHSQEEEEEKNARPSPPLCSSTPPPLRPFQSSCSSSGLHREVPLLSSSSLTPSHLSLSSLSHLLPSSSSTLPPPCRRRSLPTTSTTAGYSKLAHAEGESLMTSSLHVTSQRKYSSREKLRLISQVDSGVRQEEEEEEEEEEG